MFKTGEQVVMTDADDLFYGRLDIQIRHATSEEVAAGHRIDCKKFDKRVK